jgi:cysteine-rich repeat protein
VVWSQFPPIGYIDTIVGGGNGDGGPALSGIVDPRSVAVYNSGGAAADVYIADGINNRVRVVDGGTGIITTVAGNGTAGFSGDGGDAALAQLQFPVDVALDATGTLYIADTSNNRIRRVSTHGIITTIAGNGIAASSGDNGLATQASLDHPRGVAIDHDGAVYISEFDGDRVRKISGGIITTVAGTGNWGGTGDGGPAVQARLANPIGLALDAQGNLYVADFNNSRVRKIDTAGTITTVAGTGFQGFTGDGGLATSAQLKLAQRIAFDGAGDMLILDSGNNRVRRVDAVTGNISTIAGNGTSGSAGDGGPATQASLYAPGGLAVDAAHTIYVAISVNQAQSPDNRVRVVNPAGIINTLVGSGNGDGGPAINALVDPRGVDAAAGADGSVDLYIADAGNNRIRRLAGNTDLISTVAGTGTAGFSGDGGPAAAAQLNFPWDVKRDSAGTVWIADTFNNRVRRVNAQGIISTFAGNGIYTYGGDGGDAVSAGLAYPYGLEVDSAGNLYIADFSNDRIRKVTPQRIISTIAGTGSWGSGGDGGPATQAPLASPSDVAMAADGSLYIADYGNNTIRRVRTDGVIERVCGTGYSGFSGDGGPATEAQLNFPFRLAFDAQGNLFIGDGNNNRIRRIDAATGIITTVAGTGTAGVQGDGGPALLANLDRPTGVAVDLTGHLYIAQSDASRVRVVSLANPPAPTATAVPSATGTATRTPTRTQTAIPTSTPIPGATALSTATVTRTPNATSSPTAASTQMRTPTVTPMADPGCGNGILEAGEQCDDGNRVDGDGCRSDCTYELIPGNANGSRSSERRACLLEWSVVNPNNAPPLDRRGRPNYVQTCTNNDPSCDFDLDPTDHICEFHVVACLNNTDPNLPMCSPRGVANPVRVIRPKLTNDPGNYMSLSQALQSLRDPSTGAMGLKMPVSAAATNLCSEPFSIRVPLRGKRWLAPGRVRLLTLSRGLEGVSRPVSSKDLLVFVCRP